MKTTHVSLVITVLLFCFSQPLTAGLFDKILRQVRAEPGNVAVKELNAKADAIILQDRKALAEAKPVIEKRYLGLGESKRAAAAKAHKAASVALYGIRLPDRGKELSESVTSEEIITFSARIEQVTVQSEPSGANVMIDGHPCGTTQAIRWLTHGRHTITVDLPGHKTVVQQVQIASGNSSPIKIKLEKNP